MLLQFRTHEIAEERLYTLQSLTVAQTTDKDEYAWYVDELKSGLYVGKTEARPEPERLDRDALSSLRNKIGRR